MVFCNISQREAESESDGQIPVMGTRRFAMLGHYNISRALSGRRVKSFYISLSRCGFFSYFEYISCKGALPEGDSKTKDPKKHVMRRSA
jgi:hypothetical protein